jgi:outer membrane biosynthesis protein TonB
MKRTILLALFISMSSFAQEKAAIEKSRQLDECGIELLSVTKEDATPYVQGVLERIRKNWYSVIPTVAKPPENKRGLVAISFKIARDGSVSEMKLDRKSGDIRLDRAAWAGITLSRFEKFPNEMTEDKIAFRFRFCYNQQQKPIERE